MGKRIFCAALGLFMLLSASAEGARVHGIGKTDPAKDQAFKLQAWDALRGFSDMGALEEKPCSFSDSARSARVHGIGKTDPAEDQATELQMRGVRVHVIGETDLAEDQAFKLQVRDVLLNESEDFSDIETLEEKLNGYALACGHAANIRAEAGVFRFPDQELDGRVVPGGEYAALRVRIGKAEGRNWWSLLNPSPAACDTQDAVCYSALIEWLLSLWDE